MKKIFFIVLVICCNLSNVHAMQRFVSKTIKTVGVRPLCERHSCAKCQELVESEVFLVWNSCVLLFRGWVLYEIGSAAHSISKYYEQEFEYNRLQRAKEINAKEKGL